MADTEFFLCCLNIPIRICQPVLEGESSGNVTDVRKGCSRFFLTRQSCTVRALKKDTREGLFLYLLQMLSISVHTRAAEFIISCICGLLFTQ